MVKRARSARTRARQRAVDTLYEARVKGIDTDKDQLNELVNERLIVTTAQTPLPSYAEKIVRGIAHHIDTIDMVISGYSSGWALDRMSAMDLATLRVGTYELLYCPDVPGPVAVNEAVTIAKIIGTDQSPSFVNGLLDAIHKDANRIAASAVESELEFD